MTPRKGSNSLNHIKFGREKPHDRPGADVHLAYHYLRSGNEFKKTNPIIIIKTPITLIKRSVMGLGVPRLNPLISQPIFGKML